MRAEFITLSALVVFQTNISENLTSDMWPEILFCVYPVE